VQTWEGSSKRIEYHDDTIPKVKRVSLPKGIKGMEHHIVLVLGASLPNMPTYKTNSQKMKEIEK